MAESLQEKSLQEYRAAKKCPLAQEFENIFAKMQRCKSESFSPGSLLFYLSIFYIWLEVSPD